MKSFINVHPPTPLVLIRSISFISSGDITSGYSDKVFDFLLFKNPALLLTTQCDILVKKYETCVKISTLPLTVLIKSAII